MLDSLGGGKEIALGVTPALGNWEVENKERDAVLGLALHSCRTVLFLSMFFLVLVLLVLLALWPPNLLLALETLLKASFGPYCLGLGLLEGFFGPFLLMWAFRKVPGCLSRAMSLRTCLPEKRRARGHSCSK